MLAKRRDSTLDEKPQVTPNPEGTGEDQSPIPLVGLLGQSSALSYTLESGNDALRRCM